MATAGELVCLQVDSAAQDAGPLLDRSLAGRERSDLVKDLRDLVGRQAQGPWTKAGELRELHELLRGAMGRRRVNMVWVLGDKMLREHFGAVLLRAARAAGGKLELLVQILFEEEQRDSAKAWAALLADEGVWVRCGSLNGGAAGSNLRARLLTGARWRFASLAKSAVDRLPRAVVLEPESNEAHGHYGLAPGGDQGAGRLICAGSVNMRTLLRRPGLLAGQPRWLVRSLDEGVYPGAEAWLREWREASLRRGTAVVVELEGCAGRGAVIYAEAGPQEQLVMHLLAGGRSGAVLQRVLSQPAPRPASANKAKGQGLNQLRRKRPRLSALSESDLFGPARKRVSSGLPSPPAPQTQTQTQTRPRPRQDSETVAAANDHNRKRPRLSEPGSASAGAGEAGVIAAR